MFEKLLKKDKYLDCHYMKHSIHFFYDGIRACCSNVPGFVLYPDYTGQDVDWDDFFEKRKSLVKKINSPLFRKLNPQCCDHCSEIEHSLSDKPVLPFENVIDKVYFHNNFSCNAKCTYCTYNEYDKGYKYRVVPLIKQMIEKKILSICALIYMSGGEITISPEFEELLSMLINYVYSRIEILSSGIKYCKSIQDGFTKDRCKLIVSLDSSDAETYKKIKQVDCFDKVISNIKTYTQATDIAKDNIVLKYIIVDGVNDNNEQINNFLNLVDSLGVRNVRMDIDYFKYKFIRNDKVPNYYFDLYDTFNSRANVLGLKVETCDQVKDILNFSR